MLINFCGALVQAMREEPGARLIRASQCRNKTALGAAVLLCIFLAGLCMRGFDPSEDGWFHVLAPCTFTIWPASTRWG